jgi:hypothetical protein
MSLLAELGDRFTGPMSFRLVLQPIMSVSLAVIAGVRDARSGAPPYLWTLLAQGGHRREMFLDLWRGVGRVFVLALVMEVAYQQIVAGSISLLEAVAVSLLLAIVPYIFLRGLVNRLVRKDRNPK